MASWPLTPKASKASLSTLHCLHIFLCSEWGRRSVRKQIPWFSPPFHSQQLSPQPAHHKILNGEIYSRNRVQFQKSDFKKNPTAIIHVLVETTEQKVKYKLCLYLQQPSMRTFFAPYTERVACLLHVLTPLNIVLVWPVVIVDWAQQTSFVMGQTAH